MDLKELVRQEESLQEIPANDILQSSCNPALLRQELDQAKCDNATLRVELERALAATETLEAVMGVGALPPDHAPIESIAKGIRFAPNGGPTSPLEPAVATAAGNLA